MDYRNIIKTVVIQYLTCYLIGLKILSAVYLAVFCIGGLNSCRAYQRKNECRKAEDISQHLMVAEKSSEVAAALSTAARCNQ